MREILDNIKLGIQMLIIGALLLYIGTSVFMPEMTIKIFRFQPFVVQTESMEPEIMVNDLVVATTFNADEAQVGDIITFYADIDYNGTEEVVTHYIYSIDRTGDEAIIRTHRHFDQGEEVTPDTWLIPASDVIGGYSFHVAYLGLAVGFLKSIYGIAVIAINVVVISAIVFINKRAQRKEEEHMEEEAKLTAQEVQNPPQITV